MTDRQLWVSVFNAALSSAMVYAGPVYHNKEEISATDFAKAVADQALKDAPEDHP